MTPHDRYNNFDEERIHNEVIIVDEQQERAYANDDDPWAQYEREQREELRENGAIGEYEEIPFSDNDAEEHRSESMNPWTMITTGRILPDGSLPYHRYFIAIALMCFFSIFLTFMSLNASREYRQREKYASVLHERAVLKEEEKYSLSSRHAITARLKSHGIEMVDLSKKSRLIEK